MSLFPWFLLLHILGAIAAFGPTFAFPLIGGMGGREPMHANFATRITERIERGMTLPLAVVQGITGVGLVVTGNIDITSARWLEIAIVLYLIALGFAFFIQTKRIERVIHLSTPRPAGSGVPAMAAASAGDAGSGGGGVAVAVAAPVVAQAPAAAPAGPPPELAAAVKAVQQGGMILTVLVVTIISLMVVRPTF